MMRRSADVRLRHAAGRPVYGSAPSRRRVASQSRSTAWAKSVWQVFRSALSARERAVAVARSGRWGDTYAPTRRALQCLTHRASHVFTVERGCARRAQGSSGDRGTTRPGSKEARRVRGVPGVLPGRGASSESPGGRRAGAGKYWAASGAAQACFGAVFLGPLRGGGLWPGCVASGTGAGQGKVARGQHFIWSGVSYIQQINLSSKLCLRVHVERITHTCLQESPTGL